MRRDEGDEIDCRIIKINLFTVEQQRTRSDVIAMGRDVKIWGDGGKIFFYKTFFQTFDEGVKKFNGTDVSKEILNY